MEGEGVREESKTTVNGDKVLKSGGTGKVVRQKDEAKG